MALTHTFREAVSEGNVRKIRIMLKDSLLVDPTFERFEEMERAAASVKGLYDEHDGRSFIKNPDEWDDSYMDKMMVQVVGNFSRERVEHLKDVVRKLRPTVGNSYKEDKEAAHNSMGGSYQERKKRDQLKGDYRYSVIGGCAVVGGVAAGCVAGIVASLPAGAVAGCTIGGAVVGAVVGGVVVSSDK